MTSFLFSYGYLAFLGITVFLTFRFCKELETPKPLTWALANIFFFGIPFAIVAYIKFFQRPRLEAIKNGEPIPDSPLKPLYDWLAENVKPKIIHFYKEFGLNKDYVKDEESKTAKKKKHIID